MTAADCLYPLDAAWQSPRVAQRKKPARPEPVDAMDPPSAIDSARVRSKDAKKAPFNPTWISAGAAVISVVCVFYTVFSSPFKAIDDKLGKINDRLAAIDLSLADGKKDTKILQTWVRLRDPSFPGGSMAPPTPSASSNMATPVPSASATAPDPIASTKGPKGFPSNVAPTSPPECVSSRTFHKMPCEQAASGTCQGLAGFAPERYRQIRLQAGVGEYMLVCGEKSYNPLAEPAPP